jgi:hypothetical protein
LPRCEIENGQRFFGIRFERKQKRVILLQPVK